MTEERFDQLVAEGTIDPSDGLTYWECGILCQPGTEIEFRGCANLKWEGYYTREGFVPEWAGGAGGLDPEKSSMKIGTPYYSIECTQFFPDTCDHTTGGKG